MASRSVHVAATAILLTSAFTIWNTPPRTISAAGSAFTKERVVSDRLGDAMRKMDYYSVALRTAVDMENWQLAEYLGNRLAVSTSMALWNASYRSTEHKKKLTTVPFNQFLKDEIGAIRSAVESRDKAEFEKSFTVMVNRCNECHASASVGFIRLVIPEGQGEDTLLSFPGK